MNSKPSKDEYKMNDSWLIGFVEGEGSFSIMQTPIGHRPLFTIGQKEKEILFEIKDYLNFGYIFRSAVWIYAVTRYEDIRKIISYFDGRLLTKSKGSQFKRWKKCFNEWAKIRPKREWEKEDDETGKKMVEEGYSIGEIAKRFNRSIWSIRHRKKEKWKSEHKFRYGEGYRSAMREEI